ncbi:MAG: hypothetical protein M1814_004783 [Vezdaea aestivalis]|nr:MAG: hypothetical protein M1814_004783 [Vezdaea aestivalis]
MGNEHSTPSSKRQNRLSKPMTYGSNPNLLLNSADESASQQPRYQASPTPVVVTSNGTSRSRSDARQKIRAQLFSTSPYPSQECAVEDDLDESSNYASSTNLSRDRLSRSSSVKSFVPGARASSLSLLNTLSGSRLSLVTEGQSSRTAGTQSSNQEPDERTQPEQPEQSERQPTSRRASKGTEGHASLSRRKSFLTAGIATRGGLSNPFRKAPRPEDSNTQEYFDYYYNPKLPETSPLSRIAALDLADDRHTPRAVTPLDEQLVNSHLAGLRLGTLRITNGAASPVPSESTLGSVRRVSAEEEFFSASEGRRSDEDEASPRRIRRRDDFAHGRSKSNLSLKISDKSWEQALVDTERSRQRSKSPLKQQVSPNGSARRSSSASSADTVLRHRSRSPSDVLLTPDTSKSIAQAYQDELPDSPYMFTAFPEESSRLIATTKVSDMDAELFDDEDEISTCSLDDLESVRGGTRDAALRILDGERTPPPVQRHFDMMSLHQTSNNETIERVTLAPLLSKVDSGYSSTASERSSPRDDVCEALQLNRHSDWQTFKVYQRPMSVAAAPLRSPPSVPLDSLQKQLPSIPRRPAPPIPLEALMSAKRNSRPAIPKALPSLPADDGVQLTDSSGDADAEFDERDSRRSRSPKRPGSVANARRKLQKRRPLSQPARLPVKLITVQGYREIGQTHIPPVPSEIMAKNAQRQKTFPALEHTFPSHLHTNLDAETTAPPSIMPPIRFPSPSSTSNIRPHSPHNGHPAPQRDYSSIKPLRSDRRSSWNRTPGAAVPTITDFGTVVESLGIGPYEAARIAASHTQPRSANSALSPYRLSAPPSSQTSTPSQFTMDAATASAFARERSTMLRSRSHDRNFSRPLSMNSTARPQQHPIPPRPRSWVYETSQAPPMPRLPVAYEQDVVYHDYNVDEDEDEVDRNTRMNRILTLPENTPKGDRERKGPFLGLKSSTENLAGGIAAGWAAHKANWRERRKSAGEVLMRKALKNGEAVKVKEGGRYEGGLQYGYQAGVGVGGSAGTRSAGGGMIGGERREGDVGRKFGVDLGDVPVFVQG